jgi:multiple sugar transport system substrate-binding protein
MGANHLAEMVNEIIQGFLAGKTDPLTGSDAHGYLDPLKGWGGFGFYFLENRAAPMPSIPMTRHGCSIPRR